VSGRFYYNADVVNEEHGIRIEKFMPEDNICYDSGNNEFEFVSQTEEDIVIFQE